MTTIGIPINSDKGLLSPIADHFGRAHAFAIITDGGNLIRILPNTSDHMGGKGKPTELLIKNEINCLICKNLGAGALSKFEKSGIQVYVGAKGTVDETIQLFKSKILKKANPDITCKGHDHNSHDH